MKLFKTLLCRDLRFLRVTGPLNAIGHGVNVAAKKTDAQSWHGLLVDAHRHGLYDLHPSRSLAGIPVERWEEEPQFIAHERWTKTLHGEALHDALRPWLQFSRSEGVGRVIDFSGKHATADVARVHVEAGVRRFAPVWWSDWTRELAPGTEVLILPDERYLDEAAAAVAREFLKVEAGGIVTLHAGESPGRVAAARARLNGSIVAWLARERLLTPRTLLVHGNEFDLGDFGLIAEAAAAVVLCPAVRHALGHPHPVVPKGVRIHFGTDSPLVSGERSLIAQARMEMERWDQQTGLMAAAERAAQALLRPLPGAPESAPQALGALAELIFNTTKYP